MQSLSLSLSQIFLVFTSDPGDRGSIPGQVRPKSKKNGTRYLLA